MSEQTVLYVNKYEIQAVNGLLVADLIRRLQTYIMLRPQRETAGLCHLLPTKYDRGSTADLLTEQERL
jgi:hypothetical protein